MNRRLYYLRIAFVFVVSMFAVSCSDEMHMLFPEGPQGPQGLSAYEVWVKAVEDGEVDWPKDRTDINNFFIFLKGKDGKDGSNGTNGLSAYEIWKQEVEKGLNNPHKPGTDWPKDQITLQDFWYYLSGAPGQDGVTPHIGENGNWWIGDTDTGVPARGKDGANGADGKDGKDGKDAVAPTVEIGENGNWWINGVDTNVPARGKDGQDGSNGTDGKDGKTPTVTIGDNGNWYVDGEDTGAPATGPKGADGANGSDGQDGQDGKDGKNGTQFCLGENGYWWIWDETIGENGGWKDTGEPWKGEKGEQGDPGQNGSSGNNGSNGQNGNDGKDGKDGANGMSAYELWVEAVLSADGIYKNGELWPRDKTSMSDFWQFLRGNDGRDGVDAAGVPQPSVVTGMYNVIAQYDNSSHREYISWSTGKVLYVVTGPDGNRVANATISDMPKMNATLTFTTNSAGEFWVEFNQLPQNVSNSVDIYGRPTITIGGLAVDPSVVTTSTYVPCRIQLKMEIGVIELTRTGNNGRLSDLKMLPSFTMKRKVDKDAEWETIPSWIGESVGTVRTHIYGADASGSYKEITKITPATLSESAPGKNFALANILDNPYIEINRRVKSTEHFDFSKVNTESSAYRRCDETTWWYGDAQDEANGRTKGTGRYFLRMEINPDHEGYLYAQNVWADEYIEEVPLLPTPYFTGLAGKHFVDNSHLHITAEVCHGCLDDATHLYQPFYSSVPVNVSGMKVRVPLERTNFKDKKLITLLALNQVAGGHVQLWSKVYTFNNLLEEPLLVEGVYPGSQICVHIEYDATTTYLTYPVCKIDIDANNNLIITEQSLWCTKKISVTTLN